MGYDMYAVTPDEGEGKRVAELREVFNEACDRRDRGTGTQADVEVAYEAMERAHKSYFRLNIWGMGKAADAMQELGMLDVHAEHPAWPERKAFGVTDEMWNEWEGEVTDSTPEPLRSFHIAQEAIVGYVPDLVTGICSFKFGSNDGWLVTPAEIEAAFLFAPDAAFARPDIDWWFEWIAWLGYCKERGGFRVH